MFYTSRDAGSVFLHVYLYISCIYYTLLSGEMFSPPYKKIPSWQNWNFRLQSKQSWLRKMTFSSSNEKFILTVSEKPPFQGEKLYFFIYFSPFFSIKNEKNPRNNFALQIFTCCFPSINAWEKIPIKLLKIYFVFCPCIVFNQTNRLG